MINKTEHICQTGKTLEISLILILLFFIFSRESFRINDEATNLIMAKNMAKNTKYIINPTYHSGKDKGDWEKKSLPKILMPPVYPWLVYKVSKLINVSIIKAASYLQVIFFLIFILPIYLHHKGNIIFPLTAFTISPPIFELLTNFEHEGMLSAFGFLALYFSTKNSTFYNLMTGFFLGIGFLAKTWLVGPFVLGAGAIIIHNALTKEVSISKTYKTIFLISISFLLTSSLHLIFIYLNSPDTFSLWVKKVYFGVFQFGAKSKISSSNNNGWAVQWWYYLGVFGRECFSLSFIFLIFLQSKKTFYSLFNKKNIGYTVTLFSFIPLSLISVKEPAYILPSLLSLVFLIKLEPIKINKYFFLKCLLLVFFLITIYIIEIFQLYEKDLSQFKQSILLTMTLIGIILIYFRLNRKKLIFFIPALFGLYLTFGKYENHEIQEIVTSIQSEQKDTNRKHICANNYGMFSFFFEKDVLKFDWFLRYPEGMSKLANLVIIKNSFSLKDNKPAQKILRDNFFLLRKFEYYTVYKHR